MSYMAILIQREFWEHRNMFIVLPAIVAGLMFSILLAGVMYAPLNINFSSESTSQPNGQQVQFSTERNFEGNWAEAMQQKFSALDSQQRTGLLSTVFAGIDVILSVVLWLVILSFLLNCLFNDRRDRSILFWKSMPISDTTAVLAKLATALLALPLVYLGAIAALHISWLGLFTLSTLGAEPSAWDMVWVPAPILSHWLQYLGLVLFYGLWCLPLWGWLLAVSAYAKRTPLVSALGVPICLIVAERLISDQAYLESWIKAHSMPMNRATDISTLLFSTDMLLAVLVGTLWLGVAIWLRGRADEL
ncbi:MAG: hypothetical protein ACJ04O_10785 [Cellvibrionales bacterium]|nr:hypothetical protein [Porticoccaceae bacterium]|tara:strand:+ start:1590 stop:2501 length:912 start_codon:yes stop_codon:yes gene_type:complete